MNLISWNCNMAFRKKWASILQYRADIMVIQECEHPSKYRVSDVIPDYNEFLWYGDNINKGVGIISFGDYHIEISDTHDTAYRYVIPVKVSGPTHLDLFAVWAMPDKVKSKGYVGQVWRAIRHYKTLKNSIWIGDFNSNAIWDKERKNGNHSDVVEVLLKHNAVSVYHTLLQERPGMESQPTIYLLKKINKPYHLDYCFVPKQLISDRTAIEVGDYENWIKLSDHMPIIISELGNCNYD